MGRKEPFISLRNGWSEFLLFADNDILECLVPSLLLFCVVHNSCSCCCYCCCRCSSSQCTSVGTALHCFHFLETLLAPCLYFTCHPVYSYIFSPQIIFSRNPEIVLSKHQTIQVVFPTPRFILFRKVFHPPSMCHPWLIRPYPVAKATGKGPNTLYSVSHSQPIL